MSRKMLIAAAACLALTGCAGSESGAQESKTAQQDSVQSAAAETQLAASPEEEPEEDEDGWKKAFQDIIIGTGAKRFSLPYIDDNDTPELVLFFSEEGMAAHADCPHLFVYTGGSVTDLGLISNGGWDVFGYYERAGIVLSSFTSTGTGVKNYLRLIHGGLETEHEATMDMSGEDGGTVRYTLDGAACTEEDVTAMELQYPGEKFKMTEGDYQAADAARVLSGQNTADAQGGGADSAASAAYEWYLEPFLDADDVNVCAEHQLQCNYGYYMNTGYMVIWKNGLLGLIDAEGGEIIAPKYASLNAECVTYNAHYNFMNTGEDACFCLTDHAVGSNQDCACSLCGEMFSTCDSSEGYVYDSVDFSVGTYSMAAIHTGQDNSEIYGMGQIMYTPNVNSMNTVAARRAEITGTGDGVIGKFSGGFAPVRMNAALTDFVYDNATDYLDGAAAFCKDGKWGYLNTDGETVVPFEYDGVMQADCYVWGDEGKDFPLTYIPYLPSEGKIALNQGDKAGYVNTDGTELIPVGTFAAARPVHDGRAWVRDRETGLWGVIKF